VRTTAISIIAALLLAPTLPARADDALKTDDDKIMYTIGQMLARQVAGFSLNEKEAEIVKLGLGDAILNKEKKADPAVYGPKISELVKARMSVAAEVEKKKGAEFVAKFATEKGVEKLPSGVLYQETAAGKGDSPKATDKVKVHYKGTLIDGTEFDSSFKRNAPAEFPLNGVVKCWTEGLQKMKPGGKGKLVCPSDVAYGDQGSPPTIKPGSTLIFEVELLEILAAAPPPATDAKKPDAKPADAKPADPAKK
jgi:FKBP-type peptidyl-prolyl cis-trans isomerase FkpA